MLRKLYHKFLDCLYPRDCVSCQSNMTAADAPYLYICKTCIDDIPWVRTPYCHTCGYPFYGAVESERICPHCQDLFPEFDAGRTAYLLKGPGRDIIHELKYHKGFYVLSDIENLLLSRPDLINFTSQAILVPIPLHPKKQNKRGFNQSEEIAKCLAKHAQGSYIQKLLLRVENTATQTRKTREARLLNVKKAFALAPNQKLDSDKRYILVDDVFTTGATINTCARILKDNGAHQVDIFTIGHG